ncbi:MAG: TolC family protein [Gemmatimonadales bacterium]|nr:TolC family protein [Gemmatimonadales bacterium]
MIAALVLALQATVPAAAPRDSVPPAQVESMRRADTVPRVTLEEAIRRSARLDPDYVQALGDIDSAEWGRRAATLAFFVPSLSLGLDQTKYSTEFFNPADPANPTSTLVVGSARAEYEVLSLRKFSELGRTRAELARAEAGELEQRFLAALETESSYYDVLVNQELARVAQERVSRAREGLGVARARVASGAAVQTDSLQLVLEVTRSGVEVLRQRNALRTAQLELGRRVGELGAVDAVPLDTMPAPELPIGLPEALTAALEQGPQYRAARADERAADAALRSQRSDYLPSLGIGAVHQRYDTRIFPGAANVTSVTFSLSFPIWDNGRREIEVSRARVARDVARTIREDLERVVRRDVTSAYDTYQTSRAAVELAGVGVQVGRENYRMQEMRYRAGASTILDLLDAQVNLAEAEADLVQSRYETRLALARLEAILGRRLFSNKDAP